jgi:transposase-like protein
MGVLVPGRGLDRCDDRLLLSTKRDAAEAERFLTKPWAGRTIPRRGSLTPTSTLLIRQPSLSSKPTVFWNRKCTHRPVQYLNNILEQDHRAIKRRVRASQHFRSIWGAWRTIVGYEALHMIRKGEGYGSAAGAKVGLVHRFILGLFAATS